MHFWKKLRAGRAAICSQNTYADMQTAVVAVYEQFLKKNTIYEKDIISVQFSLTHDLTAANPATLLRSAGYASEIALFCSAEPESEGSPQGIIRLLFYYYGKKKSVPIYLGGAEKLRPDWFRDSPIAE